MLNQVLEKLAIFWNIPIHISKLSTNACAELVEVPTPRRVVPTAQSPIYYQLARACNETLNYQKFGAQFFLFVNTPADGFKYKYLPGLFLFCLLDDTFNSGKQILLLSDKLSTEAGTTGCYFVVKPVRTWECLAQNLTDHH